MKVVVVGTGFGAQVMVPAWSRAGCEVEIVSPRETDRLLEKLDTSPGIVSIHSPPFLHVEHVMLTLERGIPVLCDKPFGCNTAEAQLMCERGGGTANFINFELRWQPARMKAKELLKSGAIGALQHVTLTMFGRGLRNQAHGWLHDASLGGGWMGAYGAHGIDMLRWLTGSEVIRCGGVSRVEIAQRPDRDGKPFDCSAEDAFSAWFELGNGVTAAFDTGFSGSVNLPERIVLHGSEGALELIDDSLLIRHGPCGVIGHWKFPEVAADQYDPALTVWLPAILSAVRNGYNGLPGFQDGLAVTEVLDRLKDSVARGTTGEERHD